MTENKVRNRLSRRGLLGNGARLAALAGGASLYWRYGGETAWGQIPWEQELESTMLGPEAEPKLSEGFTIGEGILNESPRIAVAQDGTVWVASISHRDDGEQVYLTSFRDGAWGEERKLSESVGFVAHPQMAVVPGEGVMIAWSERHGVGDWRVKLRGVDAKNGELGPFWDISEPGGINWRPSIAAISGLERTGAPDYQMIVAWERKTGRRFEVVGVSLTSPSNNGGIVTLSQAPDRDCCRPSVAFAADGTPHVAWDQMDAPGGPNVYLRSGALDADATIRQITFHPAANIAPSVAVDAKGRPWIAWHSNRLEEGKWDIPRWIYLRCVEDDGLFDPVSEPLDKNLEKEGTDQSFEFARLYAAPDGRMIVTGRPSHNFCLQSYHGDEWSPLYRVPIDGWGGRGQFLSGAFDAEGSFWIVRRDIGANVLHKITGMLGEKREAKLVRSAEAKISPPAILNIAYKQQRWEPLEDYAPSTSEAYDPDGAYQVAPDAPLNVYYGDIHGHTWMSDGVGDVDEYFFHKRDYYHDDFTSLTDHDAFIRNRFLPSEFELHQEFAEHFNEEGRFVTLFGQEYTSARYPTAIGHKCIYHPTRDLPQLNHLDATMNTTEKLNAACREHRALLIPHHVGWTGTDWPTADTRIQRLAEICSNHGRFEFMGNRPIPHRGGARGSFIQDGLARGLRFGLIGGSDSHGLIWHHSVGWKRDCHRTGLACVLAPELTREAIFDAMWRRRTFATTGVKARLDFRVNNHLMGEEFTTSDPTMKLSVDVTARQNLQWITIVKNNEDWYEYGGENFRSHFTLTDEELEPGSNFYYLRVQFEGDDMAWSSPIWVDYTPA